VSGRQGSSHDFEAVADHWRVTPAFKTMIVRLIQDDSARLSALRTGEADIGVVGGDYVEQAEAAGLRIEELKAVAQQWINLPGQAGPKTKDHCAECPWVGDVTDPESDAKATKVRLALNLAVNKQAIIDGLLRGRGDLGPYSYAYFPTNPGFDDAWAVPPHDPERAKALLAEAGHADGFEIRIASMVHPVANDAPDIAQAVAQDLEKVGVKVKLVPYEYGTWLPKARDRDTDVTGWVYAAPPFDEPSQFWRLGGYTDGSSYLLGQRPDNDKLLEKVVAEADDEKRTELTHQLGQQMYDQYLGIMLGNRSVTWGVSDRVGTWPKLLVAGESNLEYVEPS
jgi:ABC-type transport system substrate-binding protein